MKNKKILFLVTQSEFGGAQRFIYTFVNGIKERYDIIVAVGKEGDNENGLLYALEKQGIKVIRLKYLRRSINPFFDFLGLIELFKFIKKQKPDILFLCSSKAGAMGSFVGRIAGVKKIIYRIGGWTFNDPWPIWKKKLYIWLEKISAKWKDIIINNAESDRQQAIKLGIKPKEKIITIYNGIDVEKLKFLNRDEAKIFLGVPLGFLIGTIANLYKTKGLKYLIEAANSIENKDINFVIIGDGQERKNLENLIKKYKLEDKILLAGAIPNAYKYLKAFDIFVLPSIKEGFPWTILEAMAAEVPIIATKVGAIPEIIKHEENGFLVEPGDPKGLAEAIKKLLENRDLREKIVKKAKKTVEKKFNLEKMIKKYEDVLLIH